MIKKALKRFLDVDKLESQMNEMEQRVKAVEVQITAATDQAAAMLGQFGGFKKRTSEELKLMKAQIEDFLGRIDELDRRVEGQIVDLLDSVDALDARMEAEQQAKRARILIKNMRKRLKINRALIIKAQAQARGA